MNVDEYLAELLLQYDYVVIPGFGALQTEYHTASIHPAQHSFEPPQKSFSFQPSFKVEDDLLVEKISNTEGQSKEEAAKRIKDFVEVIETTLHEKGAYELKGIGKFYVDIEKELKFTSHPDKNYLLSSFGLPQFVSKPVLRRENIPSYSVQPPKPEKEKKKRKFIWFRF
jgi:hypothetical protein